MSASVFSFLVAGPRADRSRAPRAAGGRRAETGRTSAVEVANDPQRSHDRRHRPVRRCRHPGRPEDVLGARRLRDERDHRPDRAEHARRPVRAPGPAGVRHRAARRGVRRRPRRCREDRHAGDRGRHRCRRGRARRAPAALHRSRSGHGGEEWRSAARRDAVARCANVLCRWSISITPNLPEAADLLGLGEASSESEMRKQLDTPRRDGTGRPAQGRSPGRRRMPDLLATGRPQRACWLRASRPRTTMAPAARCRRRSRHCDRSGRLAARRDRGQGLPDGALAAANRLEVGGGHGPVHHFHAWW